MYGGIMVGFGGFSSNVCIEMSYLYNLVGLMVIFDDFCGIED